MRFEQKRIPLIFLFTTVLAVALTGCRKSGKEPVVRAGDEVRVHYTCRLKGGELVATTHEAAARNDAIKKSALFVAEPRYEPARLTAGPQQGPEHGRTQNLGHALSSGLSAAVVAMRVGDKRTVEVTAEVPPGLVWGERYLQMARVRERSKEKTMSAGLYARFQREKAPEVGQQVGLEPGFVGTVTSVSGDEVTLGVSAEPGAVIDTIFGKGTIRDRGDRYEVEIDARQGALIRLGKLVGRIVEVNDELITTDFGHPFGGESLVCDVQVEAIERSAADEDRAVVREGDGVEVRYTISLEDGSAVPQRQGAGGAAPEPGEAGAGQGSAHPVTEAILAGSGEDPFGLGKAVLGMAVEEKKEWELPPDRAYGSRDPARIMAFPRVRREPRTLLVTTEVYARKTGTFPAEGALVNLLPYFESRVVQVGAEGSLLEHLAVDGQAFDDGFGTTTIRVEGQEIVLTLTPKLGAPFEVDGREGRVVSVEDETFTVDLNHPLAGKPLQVGMEIASVTPASELRKSKIPWIEDHAAGLATARDSGKPMVLVLYADWCGYSQRLFDETFEDARIKMIAERFVWVRVDSHIQSDLQALYGQQGFPRIVVLRPEGEIVKVLDGFKDALALRTVLGEYG